MYGPRLFPTRFLLTPFPGGVKAISFLPHRRSLALNRAKFPSPFDTRISFLYWELKPSTGPLLTLLPSISPAKELAMYC